MRRTWLPAVSVIILGACGGAAAPEGSAGASAVRSAAPTSDGAGGGSSGTVVNRQPPGQGFASVDGLEYTFDTPGGLACEVTAEEFSFSFIIGDNEIALGGGASISGGQWFGSLTLQFFGAEEGTTVYQAQLIDYPDGIGVDGNSVSYSGPMEKLPPAPPGQLSQPVAVGDGVFSATCA
jgi:hypothetical protein